LALLGKKSTAEKKGNQGGGEQKLGGGDRSFRGFNPKAVSATLDNEGTVFKKDSNSRGKKGRVANNDDGKKR